MRFSRVVLLALFAFVVVVDTLATATDSTGTRIRAKSLRTMPIVRDGIHDARRLQGGKKLLTLPTLKSLISLFRRMQLKYWIKTGKSEGFVKTALGIDGLSGKALKASPKYKYYEKFLSEVEASQMKKWLNEGPHGLATHLLWSNLGLDKIAAAERESSAAYKTYVRYATMYDDRIFQRIKSGSNPLIIQGSFSAAELNTKISIWAKAKRPKWYVKKLLDLENTSDKKLAASDKYQLFLKLEQELNQ